MSKKIVARGEKPTAKVKRSKPDDEGDSHKAKRPKIDKEEQPRKEKKNKKEPAPEVEKPAPKSVLNLEEKSFPRGGASVLTPIERKQIQNEATRDALFEETGKKPARPDDISEDDGDEGELQVPGTKKRRKGVPSKKSKEHAAVEKVEKVESLSYKKLVPGSLVLGQVIKVTSKDVAIALPNNLTGYVPLTSISDQFTSRVEKLLEEAEKEEESEEEDFEDVDIRNLFTVGQYLRTAVVSNDEETGGKLKKHIELSLNPRLTNAELTKDDLVVDSTVQASVVSVEDGGLVLDLGIEGADFKGFIGASEVGAHINHSKVEDGAVFLCLVTGHSANGRVIKLSADPAKMGDLKKGRCLTNAPSINTFLPGTAANIMVSEVTNSGVKGSIMGMLEVTADIIHAGGAQGRKELEKKVKPGSKIQARVLFSFPKNEAQKIGVSVVPHVLSLSSKCLENAEGKTPLEQLPVATIVEAANVIKVEPGRGILLDVGIPRVQAFVHISRLSDKKVDDLNPDSGSFRIDSTHRARIIGFNPMDGLFLASLEESTLSQPFLRMEDVKPGQLVNGTIEKLIVKGDGVTGLLIRLAEGIRSVVPADHMADVRLKHPERKFREGMKTKARVLSVNLEKQSIYLTMKKTLVNSEVKPWISYDAIKIGDQAPGSIVKLIPAGATIQFYGEVRAFLPVGQMSEAYIKDPSEHFRVGQVVNVHVISIDRENKRMLVSCKDPAIFNEEQEKQLERLQVGQIVTGSVTEIGKDLVSIELDAGIQGHLRVSHLTDGSDKKNASSLYNMRAGVKLHDLVLLQKMDKSRTVRVSKKPSLVQAARNGDLPRSFDQLEQGKKVDGFVGNVTGSGVFVEFGGGLTGLIPASGMPDDMKVLQNQGFGMKSGQSITATIWNVYAVESRFTLTLREDAFESKRPETSRPAGPTRELVNPIDGECTTIDDFAIGKQTLVKVVSIKELQLNVILADNVQGRIHVSEMFKEVTEITDLKRPLQAIKRDSILPVTILGLHEAKTYKFLPLSHRHALHPVFECSHRQATSTTPENLTLAKLQIGDTRLAFVHNYSGSNAYASLSPDVHGVIDIMELSSIEIDVQKAFPIGCALQTKVTKISLEKNRAYLSPVGSSTWTERQIEEGKVYTGKVLRTSAHGVDVSLAKNVWGFVPFTELSDDYDNAKPNKFEKHDAVQVIVLSRAKDSKSLSLSMRPSLTNTTDALPVVKDKRIGDDADIQVGQVVRGFVKDVSDKGMLVRLGWNVVAHVPVHDIADKFIKDFKSAFPAGTLVTGKITKADKDTRHHKMSLRESVLKDPSFRPELQWSNLEVDQIVDGTVVKVESYGVFILIKNSRNLRGLCHVSELASTKVDDVANLYTEGDKVKAKVIKLDKTKKFVNFSLKAKHFKDLQDEEHGEEHDTEEDKLEVSSYPRQLEIDSWAIENAPGDSIEEEDMAEANLDKYEDEEMVDAGEDEPMKKRSSIGGLKVGGFDWTGAPEKEERPVSEAEEDKPKKKRRKADIQVDKTGDLDKLGPQSVSDFERLLLGQPNSSVLWIQYMAFQLGLSEVDKARDVAERALKTIHMREEEEKMNVWIAFLNLENVYGSEETLDAVFERASQQTDKKEINMRLASIYIDSGKHKEAEDLFERMRKNRDISVLPDYWLNYATFLMTSLNRPDSARALLQRATQSLPTHEHARIISRFGALEFQSPNGDVERGRTVFEGLIDTYKNGWDLWDQYLAQELSKKGDVEKARGLFERMAKTKMKPKRAKYVFKRWLGWERKIGEDMEGKGNNDKQIARVKFLAEEYVGLHGLKQGLADEIV